ncbi:MAG: twin-arginine translocation signal domain-containing protein, partial [Vicinamibacterales bacterium]
MDKVSRRNFLKKAATLGATT